MSEELNGLLAQARRRGRAAAIWAGHSPSQWYWRLPHLQAIPSQQLHALPYWPSGAEQCQSAQLIHAGIHYWSMDRDHAKRTTRFWVKGSTPRQGCLSILAKLGANMNGWLQTWLLWMLGAHQRLYAQQVQWAALPEFLPRLQPKTLQSMHCTINQQHAGRMPEAGVKWGSREKLLKADAWVMRHDLSGICSHESSVRNLSWEPIKTWLFLVQECLGGKYAMEERITVITLLQQCMEQEELQCHNRQPTYIASFVNVCSGCN